MGGTPHLFGASLPRPDRKGKAAGQHLKEDAAWQEHSRKTVWKMAIEAANMEINMDL